MAREKIKKLLISTMAMGYQLLPSKLKEMTVNKEEVCLFGIAFVKNQTRFLKIKVVKKA